MTRRPSARWPDRARRADHRGPWWVERPALEVGIEQIALAQNADESIEGALSDNDLLMGAGTDRTQQALRRAVGIDPVDLEARRHDRVDARFGHVERTFDDLLLGAFHQARILAL